ncbi:hypothetical protein LTR36_006623 [Oleoguttula mirabilis]|uniref:F-box domain-containing protein n=1 Tax=Oleoguttula mirabilis TaxID=1507867 RepID=A0AAV9JBR4_9PEZI|nr:hypothetical protein LTR36_006623 [Oleoguttula mirabilis]
MATCDRVLGTYELLEDILLHLPLKDMLLAQKVSKSWLATISRSLEIQQALCMKPIESRSISAQHLQRLQRGTSHYDALQQRVFDGLVRPAHRVAVLNPLAENIVWDKGDERFQSIIHNGIVDPSTRLHHGSPSGVGSDEASWRHMQVFQPKVRRVDFSCGCGKGPNYKVAETGYLDSYCVINEGGVTFGDVVAVLQAHWDASGRPPACDGYVDGFHDMDWWIAGLSLASPTY